MSTTMTAPNRTGARQTSRTLPPSTWQALAPGPVGDPVLEAVEAEMDRPETADAIRACEAEGRYPAEVLQRLYDHGLLELFADPDPDLVPAPSASAASTVSAWRIGALCALASRRSGSLAVAIGHNGLAMLPLYLAASPEQLAEAGRGLRAGQLAALLLTERDHGSDLLATGTVAERGELDPDGTFRPVSAGASASWYRVRGEKYLINGGGIADLLVTLVRTGEPSGTSDSPFDHSAGLSLLAIRRDATVGTLGRVRTLPVAAAAIGGATFHDTLVPADALLGPEGEGFAVVQRALTISRCAIGSFAAGASNRALELALAHARGRILYGAPTTRLECVADHLARMAALDLAATALSVKATALVAAHGQGAAHYTAVAKYACCELAEAAVTEGRRAMGAAALVSSSPFERLLRDTPLYGVFDGTRHVMLEHLQRSLARASAARASDAGAAAHRGPDVRATASRAAAPRGRPASPGIAELRESYTLPDGSLVHRLRQRTPTVSWPVEAHARALAELPGADLQPLAELAAALLDVTAALRASGAWGAHQTLRFALADAFARVEAILAVVEWVDPHRRAALGLPRRGEHPLLDLDRVHPLAVHLLAAEVAGAVRRLALEHGVAAPAGLHALEAELLARSGSARRALVEHINEPDMGMIA
jgi:alkylation response protein AidB-like acyl-CoA dehydrogenase